MPKLVIAVPRYAKHRASGQAVVSIEGRDFYLGPHGTRASRVEYDRIVNEWLANGRRLPQQADEAASITVVEICAAYLKHCKAYYVKNGKQTPEVVHVTEVLKIVRELYGRHPATDFGPLALKACREKMLTRNWGRNHINTQAGRIKRMFMWAAAAEMVPGSVLENLKTVDGLRKGRTTAKESKPVMPVDDAVVDDTLPFLPPVVADMVRFQRLTGARPGEVCSMRPVDIDRSGKVWKYVPAEHKTEHHGRQRTIYIGPQGQEILRPYLLRGETENCFSPADSEKQRRAEQHASRRTPLSCGNRPGTNRKRTPKRAVGTCYTKDSYARAVNRGIDLANRDRKKDEQPALEKWSPNRLRHSKATEVRKLFGLEAAQVSLGHAKADVTQIYAERDSALAERVALATG